MAQYQVKDPSGNLHIISGPDGATPDQIITQAQQLIPSNNNPDWGGVIKSALNEASMGNGSKMRDLMSDPITQAKVLPYLTSAGALPFGGPTAGYAMGRGLSDAALASYGRSDQIPAAGQQAIELGTSLAGEAIPALGRYQAGKDIGAAESAVPGLSSVEKEAPPSNVRTAVKFMQNLKNKPSLTIEEAKAAQPAVKSVWGSPWVRDPRYSSYLPDLADASQKVSDALNQIPGRAAAADTMAQLSTIPNYVGKAVKAVPKAVKFGMGMGAGEGITDALAKAIFNIGIGK